jgi:hypothetical protein
MNPDLVRYLVSLINRLQAALKRGLQTRDAEVNLARFIGELSN